MKDLAGKTWLKVLMSFVAIALAAAVAISGFMVVILAAGKAYSGGNAADVAADMFENRLDHDLMDELGSYIETAAGSNNDRYSVLEQYETRFSRENSNIFFSVTDDSGKEILKNYEEPKPRFTLTESYQSSNGKVYSVKLYVAQDLTAGDEYRDIYEFSVWLYGARDMITVALCVSGALFIAIMCFLIYSAGRRPGVDEIKARWMDRVPCDLLTALAVIALSCCVAVSSENSADIYKGVFYLGLGLDAAAAAAVAIVFCMSWAVRFRIGKWWKCSVIYYVLHWLKKPCVWLWELLRSIPLVWKAVVFALAVLLLELIAMAEHSGLMWCVVNFGLALLIIYAALNMRALKTCAKAMADGELDARVDTSKMHWDFKAHGDDLNRIGDGIELAVEKQLKSERLKTELITNVSHDIKTPLTSIINYVDLLKKEDLEPEKAREYVAVLDRQSARLRKLTEDVIEASKASTGNIYVQLGKTGLNTLLTQAVGEYADKFSDSNLEPVMDLTDEMPEIMADGRLLWRVFDNLLSNAVKYAMPGTRIYISSGYDSDRAYVTVKNVSGAPLNISAEELMERFVQGDASRSTSGSGLGLSIAESLVRLQHGEFSLDIDGDLFKATVSFAVEK